jgi:hypothetical protein
MDLARGLNDTTRKHFQRAWLARLMALVFALQTVGLFLPPAGAAPAAAGMAAAIADCPHHRPSGHVPGQHDHENSQSDSCPMCQSLGCALAGAAPPVLTLALADRLIGPMVAKTTRGAPSAPPLQSPPPRGPPVFV